MKRIHTSLILCCLGLLFAASTCFAQMYTVTDLASFRPTGINLGGQVVGNLNGHAYLWIQSSGFQDLGTLAGGTFSYAAAINDLGAVTGAADGPATIVGHGIQEVCGDLTQPFVWTQKNGMQGLGGAVLEADIEPCDVPFYGTWINIPGQVVGYDGIYTGDWQYGFLWTNSNGMTQLGDSFPPSSANAISNTGQIVGQDTTGLIGNFEGLGLNHANSWKSGVETDLGTLGGEGGGYYASSANGVNDLGQVVGWSNTAPIPGSGICYYGSPVHAVLWAASGAISDLGTLPGDTLSTASQINFFGQVIGSSGNTDTCDYGVSPYEVIGRPFIWSDGGVMQDLNTLIPANSGWVLGSTSDINSLGQIVGVGTLNGEQHGFLLTPIYKASVQQPINGDGSSVFSAKRGVVPVKFTLTQNDVSTCVLSPATIAVTRTAGGTLGSVDESTYLTNADSGSNFRIDGCQYVYNLAASSLGVGTYRVDISIKGIMVGHAVFAL